MIFGILDEGLVCHVGFALDGDPIVIPTSYARIEDRLYLHGSSENRMLRALGSGAPACVAVTLLDGLVLARSAKQHSMNYRSVVLFGRASEVSDPEEKRRALDAIVEHVVRGRARAIRCPTKAELDSTLVVELPIAEASAKVRAGPPVDLERDHDFPAWAGVIPLRLAAGTPVAAPGPAGDLHVPREVAEYERESYAGRGAADARSLPEPRSATPTTCALRGPHIEALREVHLDGFTASTDPQRIDVELVHAFLSRESYWARGIPRARVEKAIQGSICFGVYESASRSQIGFARVVSDRATFAYLCDVFILDPYRGRGLGTWLLSFIDADPSLAGLRRWLLGTRDAHGLYKKRGWTGLAHAERFMERFHPYDPGVEHG